jgi:hypothetical protein
MEDSIIKKKIMYELLGMIVANMKDYEKISWKCDENKEEFSEPDENRAELISIDFLKNHKVVLDVNLETMIHEKTIQKAVYSYCFYGGTKLAKIGMLITYNSSNYSINEFKTGL